ESHLEVARGTHGNPQAGTQVQGMIRRLAAAVALQQSRLALEAGIPGDHTRHPRGIEIEVGRIVTARPIAVGIDAVAEAGSEGQARPEAIAEAEANRILPGGTI